VQHGVDGAVDGERLADVLLQEGEAGVLEERGQVRPVARQEVVEADDLVAPSEEELAEVRRQEPGRAGDDRARHQRPTPR
jgi:hypothetical protein